MSSSFLFLFVTSRLAIRIRSVVVVVTLREIVVVVYLGCASFHFDFLLLFYVVFLLSSGSGVDRERERVEGGCSGGLSGQREINGAYEKINIVAHREIGSVVVIESFDSILSVLTTMQEFYYCLRLFLFFAFFFVFLQLYVEIFD